MKTEIATAYPYQLWLDEHPIPDLFATPPWELPALLFADPEAGAKLLTAGLDFNIYRRKNAGNRC